MFLNDFFNSEGGKNVSKLAKQSSTFNGMYRYWLDILFERVMRLFVWENTGEVPPKEIESRLILNGHLGITKLNGELTAMFGSFCGVTKYYDEWTNYIVRCPVFSGERTIDKDVAIINNNAIRNPVYPLIHHYAVLLAHTEVTLLNCLVNARDAGGVPIAGTEKQKRSINDYLSKIFNGEYGVVTDVGNLGIEYAGADRHTNQSLIDIVETREKLIKSFYSDIGVRSAFEKRNNTVQAEVEADTSLLLLNLADMIKCRKEGAEKVNKMFGTNWAVHIAKEIDYSTENERDAFGTHTEIHVKENTEDAASSDNK